MSNYNQSQAAYPPPATADKEDPQGGKLAPPPPVGYPMNYGQQDQIRAPEATTQSRGEGFWKGCCAVICCCCLLDACF